MKMSKKLFSNILSLSVVIILFAVFTAFSDAQVSDNRNTDVVTGDTTKRKLRVKKEAYRIYAPKNYSIEAVKNELNYAVKQWQHYFNQKPPTLGIVLYQTSDARAASSFNYSKLHEKGFAVLPWTLNSNYGAGGEGTLSHEACHAFFIEWIDQRRNMLNIKEMESGRLIAYGAENVPDWFDESIAILCESRSQKVKRSIIQFPKVKASDHLIELSRLLKMQHPYGIRPKVKKKLKAMKASDDSTGKIVIKVPEGGLEVPGLKADKDAWYPQIFVFTQWLVQKAGQDVIEKIANVYAKRKPFKVVLKAEPNLPNSIKVLEKQWQKYLVQQ